MVLDPREQAHIDSMESDGFTMVIPKFRSRDKKSIALEDVHYNASPVKKAKFSSLNN